MAVIQPELGVITFNMTAATPEVHNISARIYNMETDFQRLYTDVYVEVRHTDASVKTVTAQLHLKSEFHYSGRYPEVTLREHSSEN